MDEVDAVSLASVKMRDDTAHRSTAYSMTSEPPPFYKERVSTSVRIARLVAATIVAMSLILGAAIIVAAYLQSKPETNHHFQNDQLNAAAFNQSVAAAAAAAALTAASADNPAGSDVDALKKQKGLRRLDTNADDLLEAFLENEGKILRLPVEDNSQINISDLAKMFLKRNRPQKTKCFIERRRSGVDDVGDVVTMIPIPLNEVILRDSIAARGYRVSLICNSDRADSSADRSARIPISMAMPTAMMFQSPMQGVPFPIRSDPVPIPALPSNQMLPPPPSPMFVPMDRSMHLPSIPMRSFFPPDRFGAGPFRFPIRPTGQWQRPMPFPQVHQHRSIFRVPEPSRANFLPYDDTPEEIPVGHQLHEFRIPQRLIHTPNFRKSPPISDESEESEESGESEDDPAAPVSRFRVPLPVTTASPEALKILSGLLTPPESGDVQDQSLPVTLHRPVTLPFLHVPKRVAMRRPSSRNPEAEDAAKNIRPEHRSGSVTLFERLMDSIIGGGMRRPTSPDADDRNADEAKGIVVAVPMQVNPNVPLVPSDPSGAVEAAGVPSNAAPVPSGTINGMNLMLRSPLMFNLSGRNGGGPNRRIDPLIARGMRLPSNVPNHFHAIHGVNPLRRPIDGLSPQLDRFDPREGPQGPPHSIQPRR